MASQRRHAGDRAQRKLRTVRDGKPDADPVRGASVHSVRLSGLMESCRIPTSRRIISSTSPIQRTSLKRRRHGGDDARPRTPGRPPVGGCERHSDLRSLAGDGGSGSGSLGKMACSYDHRRFERQRSSEGTSLRGKILRLKMMAPRLRQSLCGQSWIQGRDLLDGSPQFAGLAFNPVTGDLGITKMVRQAATRLTSSKPAAIMAGPKSASAAITPDRRSSISKTE